MNAEIQGVMGFALPEDVVKDTERKGRLRAKMKSRDYSEASQLIDFKSCRLNDLSHGGHDINFFEMGFDQVDLSQNKTLTSTLEKVKAQGFLERVDEKAIRNALNGSVFRLHNGKRLRIVFVAGEGLIIRSSGPNGMGIEHGEAVPKNSRQAAALLIHGDQDVYGYPLKRIMKGAAPWIFRHNSPDGSNRISPMNLVNLWIPLQQVVMPLCLMDRSTLDKKNHQLRMEISVGEVLDRDESLNRNDIWTFLHDDKQEWYFDSEMSYDKAWLFDTLGMAHGAAILPGEKQAEQYFLRLSQCEKAINEGDIDLLREQASKEKLSVPDKVTQRLSSAISEMESLLDEAAASPEKVLEKTSDWLTRSQQVRNTLVRKSIELRAIGICY